MACKIPNIFTRPMTTCIPGFLHSYSVLHSCLSSFRISNFVLRIFLPLAAGIRVHPCKSVVK